MSIAAAMAQRRRNIANERKLNTLNGPEQSKLFFSLGNNAAKRREAIRTAGAAVAVRGGKRRSTRRRLPHRSKATKKRRSQ